jgi:integrase
MKQLREREELSARALEWTIITAARTAETLEASWSEIDLEAKTWTIPAERMKSSRVHVIPLPKRAVTILEALPRTGELLFPGSREGQPLSNNTMAKLLRGMVPDVTVHGMRSTFRDWAGDCTAYPRDLIETALAHAIKDKTEAAYRRSSALEKRRKLMDDWASYCESKPADMAAVTPIGRARA